MLEYISVQNNYSIQTSVVTQTRLLRVHIVDVMLLHVYRLTNKLQTNNYASILLTRSYLAILPSYSSNAVRGQESSVPRRVLRFFAIII